MTMVMVMMELAMVMGNAAGDVGADHDVDRDAGTVSRNFPRASIHAELYSSFC